MSPEWVDCLDIEMKIEEMKQRNEDLQDRLDDL